MAKPSKKAPEPKLQIVLSVLRGEHTAIDAARRNSVLEQAVHNWKRRFLDSGRQALEKGARRPCNRQRRGGGRDGGEQEAGVVHRREAAWAL